MVNRVYEKTGEKVSLLGFGGMRFPTLDDKIDEAKAEELLDMAYAHGVNYFDTAYRYHDGESQSFMGRALKKYDRSTYYLTNKLPIWLCDTPEDMERIFQDQLDKCQVEYFDFYLLHALCGSYYEKCEKFGAYEFLRKKKEEGRIRHLGFSFHDTPELLDRICSEHQWDFAQIQLNYLDWEMERAGEQYEVLCRHGLQCVIMEPVRGGSLSCLADEAEQLLKDFRPDMSVSSWAIRYAASLPNVLTVLSGMTLKEHVEDNLRTMEDFTPLAGEERAVLDKALAIHKQICMLPCTGCRYCIDCPAGVSIPDIFHTYNKYMLSRNKGSFLKNMEKLQKSGPEHCLTCGACVEKCPQKIQIPQELAKIQALYEELKG